MKHCTVKAVYPGSFDPITNGHMDVIKRAAALFDSLTVAVLQNPSKQGLLSPQIRCSLVKQAIDAEGLSHKVEVKQFSGLLINFMKIEEATVLVRGVRAMSDFDYEFQMALTNKKLYPEAETIFLAARSDHTFVSSSLVRELSRLGGDYKDLVPQGVWEFLENYYRPGGKVKTRAYTRDEIREAFVNYADAICTYASKVEGKTREEAIRLAVFSIFSALDGEAGDLPKFVVAPDPHPEDKAYLQDQGKNWYPEHETDPVDITGELHSLFSKRG